MTALLPYLALLGVAFIAAAVAGQVDHCRLARAVEWTRLTAPLPPPRLNLTEEIELVHIGGRTASLLPATAELADDSGCSVPCTARHCALHTAPGTAAQNGGYEHHQSAHVAWNTPTDEWSVSLLGLTVPDFPPQWSEAT